MITYGIFSVFFAFVFISVLPPGASHLASGPSQLAPGPSQLAPRLTQLDPKNNDGGSYKNASEEPQKGIRRV